MNEQPGKYYTMFLAILTMITALAISAVAIYYSVAGLVAIFAAAAIPIIIMGTTLELAKLVTAVWLHRYWKQAAWWLKYYLALAVLILMFITSMGIFGYLSKAHIEQTSAGVESVAQVERITTEITRQQELVVRAETKIVALQSSGISNDSIIQEQIDKEQERIDTAYDRIQPAITEQNLIIANVTTLFQGELDNIDASIARLQSYIDAGEIKKAQGMIGSKADGAYGPKTAAAFTAWTDSKKLERNGWIQKIQDAAQSDTIVSARKEISKLRDKADNQIAESNKLINRLRTQVGKTDKVDEINLQVDEQNLRIKTANTEIDLLTEEQYSLEGEYRQLEAEVGPIKYIAEFVYGEDADKNMLEKAVTWVIIIIIFVFDPLAVLLLIASQYTFDFARKNKGISNDRARMQKIVDNPGPINTKDDYEPDEPVYVDIDQEDIDREFAETTTLIADDTGRVEATEQDYNADEWKVANEQLELDFGEPEEPKKKVESSDELNLEELSAEEQARKQSYEEKDLTPEFKTAKHAWKDANPNLTLKMEKNRYIKGTIDVLPWEEPKAYIKQNDEGEQVRIKPDLTQVIEPEGYQQNAEQNESTIFNKLNDK
tara:strand:- start:67 stop:1875 length:1809 start_codon:yes stop_codon:yes gene_type:complete